jgi:hypothetical protein
MRTPEDYAKLLEDPLWRINNLYYITTIRGEKIQFKLNWAQEELYNNMWYLNVILKARQLGMSTFVCILFLDRCLFNSHQSAGIIAHTGDDVRRMFMRVKFAYDNLPERVKRYITCDNDTAQMLKFSNGSSLSVGTSLRSATLQYLHVSEFGKICAKYPDKAQEIISGSLNTVATGQYIFIESTAEGREGYFYDMCKRAENNKGKKLTKLDFKFHFFPWFKEPSYSIGSTLSMDNDLLDYFNFLAGKGIKLEDHQKNWYASKHATQPETMLREYPSTPDEAWEQANEGTYYGKQMTLARLEGRVGFVPYDDCLEVHTAWDLGRNDMNVIWFFQLYGKEIRLIDYEEGGDSLQHWIGVVRKKPYVYGKHLAPHDIKVHEYSSGISRLTMAREIGFHMFPVTKHEVIPGIDMVKNIFNRCWFDEKKCKTGLHSLENYKKEWDDKHGCFRSTPLHNWASHGADAFRTLACGLSFLVDTKTADRHNPAEYLANRFRSGF